MTLWHSPHTNFPYTLEKSVGAKTPAGTGRGAGTHPGGAPQTWGPRCPHCHNSPPTERKSRAELTPAERLLNRCSWCRMPPITMHRPLGTEEKPTKEIPHQCSAHSTLPALSATHLTGTKRTQPTSVPVNADFTTSA